MKYKNPESILIVIYCSKTSCCLMLQRNDDENFWQSVTGSLEIDESPKQAALRELKEETGIHIENNSDLLIDANYSVEFEIFPQFLHRYAPNVNMNKEHWFYLNLPSELTPILTEHSAFCWLPYKEAMKITPSWNNREAIERLIK